MISPAVTSQVVYLSHIGIWDKESRELPGEYLQALDAALAAGLKQLILLTVPTEVGVLRLGRENQCMLATSVADLR